MKPFTYTKSLWHWLIFMVAFTTCAASISLDIRWLVMISCIATISEYAYLQYVLAVVTPKGEQE